MKSTVTKGVEKKGGVFAKQFAVEQPNSFFLTEDFELD